MFNMVLAMIIAAVVASVLADYVIGFLPSWFNAKGKMAVSLVLAILSGLLFGLCADFSATGFGKALQIILTIVGTITINKYGYDLIIKPIRTGIDILKEKLKTAKNKNSE